MHDALVSGQEQDLRKLLFAYNKATQLHSNPNAGPRICAGKRLIAIGEVVVSFIFKERAAPSVHEMALLEKITGQNPVRRANAGSVPLMQRDWRNWAEQNNYC